MSSTLPQVPEELSRFPAEAKAAYTRFVSSKSEADLRIIVKAALADFMPKRHSIPEPGQLESSKRLVEDLGLDSLAIAELVFFFEDLFHVSIPSTEILGLQTVEDLENYVGKKLSERPPAG